MYTVVRSYMENPKRITYHVEAVKSDTSEFIVHAMKVCGFYFEDIEKAEEARDILASVYGGVVEKTIL